MNYIRISFFKAEPIDPIYKPGIISHGVLSSFIFLIAITLRIARYIFFLKTAAALTTKAGSIFFNYSSELIF